MERALPALGFEGVGRAASGGWSSCDVSTTSARVAEMCERLLANPLIEDYEVVGSRTSRVRFGVLRFPGSCDEVDALLACRRFADAELLWHGDRDLRGRRRRRGARRLLLRRLPARRRDRALLAGDGGGARVRARRRPGARHLQRLPGALRGRPAAGRAAAQRVAALRLPPGRRRGRDHADTPFTRACRAGRRPVDPGQAHDRPLLRARGRSSTSSRRTARCCCATPTGQNPNGSIRDIAGVSQPGAGTWSA